jgi:hypothetical protein
MDENLLFLTWRAHILPQLLQYEVVVRATNSFRWSFNSVMVPTVERDVRTGLVWSMALALGINSIRSQRRFSRTGDAGDYHQLVQGDINIQVFLSCFVARLLSKYFFGTYWSFTNNETKNGEHDTVIEPCR